MFLSNLEHVGFIMDGNRRYARRLMLEPWRGHEGGKKKIREVLAWCRDAGIRKATFYALSLDNLNKRPEEEKRHLFRLFEEGFLEMARVRETHENRVRVRVVGHWNLLPEGVRRAIETVINATSDYDRYEAVFCLAYSGRQEIVDAVNRAIENGTSRLTMRDIEENLDTEPPQLIIRTGGEKRISDFLLWHAAYAELAFVDEKWPEFSRETFEKVIRDYHERERRFGA